MESDARFYRRRATEELAAANRAVTEAARQRRMQLAQMFLERLQSCDETMLFNWGGPGRIVPQRDNNVTCN